MANKGLIGVQMSTIAPAKMPHFDAYESMGKLSLRRDLSGPHDR